MPYLEKSIKDSLDHRVMVASEPGHLTYRLYKECLSYIKLRGKRFAVLCEVVGALVCCLLELYRRVVAPYEEEKIKINGDVK